MTQGLEAEAFCPTFTSAPLVCGHGKGAAIGWSESGQAMQLATVQAAQEQFLEEVVFAAADAAPGIPRLKALLEAYFKHIERRANRGGCFATAATLEFDDRPGQVRDELVALGQMRSRLICAEITEAAKLEKAKWDVPQLAFKVTALAVGRALILIKQRLGHRGEVARA